MASAGRTRLSELLEQMIERAKRLRDGDWEKSVRAIEDFERPQQPEPGSSSKVKMTLTSQFNREVGSRLYNKNPTVRVQAEEWADQAAKARAPVEENLLNLAMDRTGFFHTFRDAITDSFSAMGCLWHGLYEDDPRLPTVEWVRWEDIWFDPDVKRRRDANYIVRRCRHPKYKLIEKYARNENGTLKQSIARKIMAVETGNLTEGESEDRDGVAYTGNSVVYYKVYTKVGLDAFDEDLERAPDKDTVGEAKYYVILDNSWDVLHDGPWETPYHIAGDWPLSELCYYGSRNLVYPAPPLEPGVPWMEALNKAVNDLQSQYKFTSRMVVAVLEGAGIKLQTGGIDEMRKGSEGAPIAFVNMECNSAVGPQALKGMDIRRFMHVMDLGDDRYVQKLEHIRQLKDEWYRAVGLNDFMYFGDTPRQDRSAQATQARERHAMSRIADMQSCIDAFASDVLRKMLFTARVHDTEEDIAGLMGEQAGKLWGTTLAGDKATPDYWQNFYGENPEEVAEGSTPEEVARQTLDGGVDVVSWLDSTNVSIELGSTSRKTPEQEEESIAQANNQLVPSLNNMGMPLAASLFVGKRAELLSMSADEVATIVKSGATSQQLIDLQKQLEIMQLQAQVQQLQQQMQAAPEQAQQAQAQQQMQAEQAAQQQALEEERMFAEQDQRGRELDIRQQEADAKSLQAMRPADRSKP